MTDFEDAVAERRNDIERVAESDLDCAWIAQAILNAAETGG